MKPLLIALVLAIASGLSYWISQHSTKALVANNYGGGTDYEISGLHLTQYQIDGSIKQTLTAKEVRHFTSNGNTQLIQPDMIIYSQDANRPPWKVVSESALLNHDQTELLLLGKVDMLQKDEQKGQTTHIITRDMTLYPKRQYAESSDPVEAIQGNNRVTANSFKLWYGEQRKIQLINNVKAHYETH